MLMFRTKLLLALMFASGLGIGVLSGQSDGIFSAACLFVLPVLVALGGASIIKDLSQLPRKTEAVQTEKDHQQDAAWPHAA